MANAGINWGDINVLSQTGVNWSDVGVLSAAGLNWSDMDVMRSLVMIGGNITKKRMVNCRRHWIY